MSSTAMELTERLYRRLLGAARERDGELRPTLTIGDLYQELIPYRAVRGELGVFELAQYENALLRLLAGEGGYLRLVDEGVRGELSAELNSPNPILGIYRDYPAQLVELTWVRKEDAAASPPQTYSEPKADLRHRDETSDVRSIEDLIAMDDDQEDDFEPEFSDEASEPLPALEYPLPRPAPADATRVERPARPPQSTELTDEAPATPSCLACGEPLPEVDGLRYCPHCGADQTEVPCTRCGAAIRASWNFCIRCGSPRPSTAIPD